jgi:hypothetical protein
MSEELPRFVMCICTGQCPGFESLNLWDLINYVRNELDVEYALVHPQLCVDDGDAFWRDYAKPGKVHRRRLRPAHAAQDVQGRPE